MLATVCRRVRPGQLSLTSNDGRRSVSTGGGSVFSVPRFSVQLLLGLLMLLSLLPGAVFARSELQADPCPERNDGIQNACRIGTLGRDAIVLKGSLDHPGDVDAYEFEVGPLALAGTLALTDLSSD